MKLLIREALGIFGADKTGMVDYALESAGEYFIYANPLFGGI